MSYFLNIVGFWPRDLIILPYITIKAKKSMIYPQGLFNSLAKDRHEAPYGNYIAALAIHVLSAHQTETAAPVWVLRGGRE